MVVVHGNLLEQRMELPTSGISPSLLCPNSKEQVSKSYGHKTTCKERTKVYCPSSQNAGSSGGGWGQGQQSSSSWGQQSSSSWGSGASKSSWGGASPGDSNLIVQDHPVGVAVEASPKAGARALPVPGAEAEAAVLRGVVARAQVAGANSRHLPVHGDRAHHLDGVQRVLRLDGNLSFTSRGQSSSSSWGGQSNKGWGQQSSGGSSWGQQSSSPGWGAGSGGGSSWGASKSSWNSGSGSGAAGSWKSGGSSPGGWGAQGGSGSQWGAGGGGSWGKTTGSSWGSQGSWNSQQGPPQQNPTIQYGMVPPVPEVYIATPKENKPETPTSLSLGTSLGTYKMTPRSAIKIKPRTAQYKEEAAARPAVSWSQDIKKLSFDSVDSTPRKSPLDEAIDFMPATPQRTPGSPKTPIRSPRSPDEGPQESTPFLKLPPVHLLDNDPRIESTPITLRFPDRPEQENKPPSRIASTPLGLTYTLSDVGSVTFEQLPLSSQSKIDEGALDSLLEFDPAGKTLQVHPNRIASTETYKHLANRPALIALHEIWPLDRKTGAQLRDPTEHAATFARLSRRLEQQSIDWGGEFVSYEDGTWTWRATPLFS